MIPKLIICNYLPYKIGRIKVGWSKDFSSHLVGSYKDEFCKDEVYWTCNMGVYG